MDAVRYALDEAGVTLKDIDFVEINEAFAAQVYMYIAPCCTTTFSS